MDSILPQLSDGARGVKDALVALSSCLCQPSTNLKLNGRTYTILKLLGEGGFSYVYLVQDTMSGRQYALKKIRCPAGSDNAHLAMKEIEAHRRFRHPNCIRCLDSCVTNEDDTKVVYMFLPFYKRGNLQDVISAYAVNGSRFSEKDLLNLFYGTCEAVRAMHTFAPGPSATYPPNSSPSIHDPSAASSRSRQTLDAENNDVDNDHAFAQHGDDQQVPLMSDRTSGNEQNDSQTPAFDEDASKYAGNAQGASRDIQPWAHRDIKPGNVMLSNDGKRPILMDFGSAMPARIRLTSRNAALEQQDIAAEHSTMPYRAPELFDVQTDTMLDEKVDIWSLGCTLFAVAYGYSPFEGPQDQQGGSIMLAVTSGKFRFPRDDNQYSKTFKDLISSILVVDPIKRPDIHQVLDMCKSALHNVS